MCLPIHFVLNNVYVPFGNCKYYVAITRFELLSFEHVNPISHKLRNTILWLFCSGTIKFSYTKRYSISYPFIFQILCPYIKSPINCFHGKDLIVKTLYVHLKDRKKGGSKLMFMPFEIFSICVWL